jgi:hypothetical protein
LEEHATNIVSARPRKDVNCLGQNRDRSRRFGDLANLLRTDLLPRSYLRSQSFRELRDVLLYRAQFGRLRTVIKNRVYPLMKMRGLTHPVTIYSGAPVAAGPQSWNCQPCCGALSMVT